MRAYVVEHPKMRFRNLDWTKFCKNTPMCNLEPSSTNVVYSVAGGFALLRLALAS